MNNPDPGMLPQTPEPQELTLARVHAADFHLGRALRNHAAHHDVHLYLDVSEHRGYTDTALLNLAVLASKVEQHRHELLVTFFDHKIRDTIKLVAADYAQLIMDPIGHIMPETTNTKTDAINAWRELLDERSSTSSTETDHSSGDLEQVWAAINSRPRRANALHIVAGALEYKPRNFLAKHPQNLYYLHLGDVLSPEAPDAQLEREILLGFIEALRPRLGRVTHMAEDRILNHLSTGDINHACGFPQGLTLDGLAEKTLALVAQPSGVTPSRQTTDHARTLMAVGHLWDTLRTQEIPRWKDLNEGTQAGIYRLMDELSTGA